MALPELLKGRLRLPVVAVAPMLLASGPDLVLACCGTRSPASREAMTPEVQKDMIVAAGTDNIIYRPAIAGGGAKILRRSIPAAGLDETRVTRSAEMEVDRQDAPGAITDIPSVAGLVARMAGEMGAARGAW